MDMFHYILLAALILLLFGFLRERKQKKKEMARSVALEKYTHELHAKREVFSKEILLSLVSTEKIFYRPAEPRLVLNFVYPPPAPEMLIVKNLDSRERKVMDSVDKFLGGKVLVGKDYNWFQIPGPVSPEEKELYPHIAI